MKTLDNFVVANEWTECMFVLSEWQRDQWGVWGNKIVYLDVLDYKVNILICERAISVMVHSIPFHKYMKKQWANELRIRWENSH